MKIKSTIGALVAIFGFAATSSNGAVVLNDTFTYTNGDLVGKGSWAAHSGAASVPVQVMSNAISLAQGSGSREDVSKALTATMGAGQTFYSGFDLTVAGGSTEVYFAHFMSSSTTFVSRAFVTAPTISGYQLGISSNQSTPDAKNGTDLVFGTTYRIVQSYNFDTGVSSLWINPTSAASPSISSVTADIGKAVSLFGFRQSAGNSTQGIDNLTVATTFAEVVPEPSTALLGAIGVLALLRRRR